METFNAVERSADMVQIGARNRQNFALLPSGFIRTVEQARASHRVLQVPSRRGLWL